MLETHSMEHLVERMTIQTLPYTQNDASMLAQHTMHFLESCMFIRKEHQPKLAQDQVKVLIWIWKTLCRACMPFNYKLISFSCCACHVNHVWVGVEADDSAPRSDKRRSDAGDNPCAASYVQDTLTR